MLLATIAAAITMVDPSWVTNRLRTDTYVDCGGRTVENSRPIVIEKDAFLDRCNFTGDLYLGGASFTLRDVKARGIVTSRVKSARLIRTSTEGGDVGLLNLGGGNISVEDSAFRNHRIGFESMPGDASTWPDTAKDRGVAWYVPGNEYKAGLNLNASLDSLNDSGAWFVGDGSNRGTIKLGAWPTGPVWKVDSAPLADNWVSVSGKAWAKWVAETKDSATVEADGVFERGRVYYITTRNPKYDVKNIRVVRSSFDNCRLAGVSFYFTDGVVLEYNHADGTSLDYAYGLEYAKNGVVRFNSASLWPDPDYPKGTAIRFGMVGAMDNVRFEGNGFPVHADFKWQRGANVVADVPVYVVGAYGKDGRPILPWGDAGPGIKASETAIRPPKT